MRISDWSSDVCSSDLGVGAANPTDPRNRFQFLNPAAGCRGFDSVTITPEMSNTSPLTTCEVDFQGDYIMLQPEIERKGLTARFTANVGDRAQVYAIANYYQTKSFASFTPLGFNGSPTPPNNGPAPSRSEAHTTELQSIQRL